MITITTTNGTQGSGETVAAAAHDLLGDREVTVQVSRGHFVPVEQASAEDVRRSGVLWGKKDRTRHVVALVDDVTETGAAVAK